MPEDDKTIDNLLELDDTRFVVEERLGLWVKFEAKRIAPTSNRPQGIRYSLSLHDRFNMRIMGFDNAHAIEYGRKTTVAPKRTYSHWHKNQNDSGQPYDYITAGKLLEDFWTQVDLVIKKLGGN
jgi:hypothetical protein